MTSLLSPSQTMGPFPHEAWRWGFTPEAQPAQAANGATPAMPRIVVSGQVLDGDGLPINDAMLEAFVPGGPALVPGMPGWQRVPSGENGEFSLSRLGWPAKGEPAFWITVFARGLLRHQFTAVWLPEALLDDASKQAVDAAWAPVPTARRQTLLAQASNAPTSSAESLPDPLHAADEPHAQHYRWCLHLQGPSETVFFDFA